MDNATPEQLTPEQLEDAQGGISLALRYLRGVLQQAEDNLLTGRCTDYSDYLRKYHRVEAFREAVQELRHLKDRGKDILT